MSHRYRKSSKLSLSVSLFWIVGFLALLFRGSGALLGGQPLLAADEKNLQLVLPAGNSAAVNKTLRFESDIEEIVFIVHRPDPSCFVTKQTSDGNTVEFWLGDESCKMNLMWSDDAFRLGNDKQGPIVPMPTTGNATVTLKKNDKAIVTYKKKKEDTQEQKEKVGEMWPSALKDNPNTVKGFKDVQIGMKGDTKCGMTLEFDKNVHEYVANEEKTTKKPKPSAKTVEENSVLGMSTGLFIGLVVIVLFLLLAGITAAVVYFCCFKGRRSKKVDPEAENQPEQVATHKSIASEGFKMDESTAKLSSKSYRSKTPVDKESKSSSSSDHKKKRKKAEESKSKKTKKGKKMQKKRGK